MMPRVSAASCIADVPGNPAAPDLRVKVLLSSAGRFIGSPSPFTFLYFFNRFGQFFGF
jgi:hypothetical protein